MTKRNPARQQALALINLGRSYIRDGTRPKSDIELLRFAVEALLLEVEVLIKTIEVLPDDTRAGAMHRASVMHRLAGVLANAATIGSWDLDHGKRLRAKVMRENKAALDADLRNRLRTFILEGQRENRWGPLAPTRKFAESICSEARKAFGDADGYPSPSTILREVREVLGTTPKKK